MGPCVAYCLCSRLGSVAVAVPAPTILCFAPLSIVTHANEEEDVACTNELELHKAEIICTDEEWAVLRSQMK